MQDDSWKQDLNGPIQIIQIIHAAMILSCLIYAGIAIGNVVTDRIPAQNTAPLLTYIGAGLAFVLLVLRAIVPEIIVSRGRRAIAEGRWDEWHARGRWENPTPPAAGSPGQFEQTGNAGRLAALYNLRGIVGLALLESGCFVSLTVYLFEQEFLSLAVAGGLLAVMAIGFPFRDRVFVWIERQLRDLDAERRQEA